MKKYEVELRIDPFIYEIDAENEKEAKEAAMIIMFEDIHHCPTAIISDVAITEIKKKKN